MDNTQEKLNGVFSSLIGERINLMGISQNNLAENIGTTPAQLSIFLKGESPSASLSPQSLDAALAFIGIDMKQYSRRLLLANKVAETLIDASVDNIDKWSKEQLSSFTGFKEINYFFDVDSAEEMENIIASGIIDYESTYAHFKALVSYSIGLKKATSNTNLTSSEAKKIASSRLNEVEGSSFEKFKTAGIIGSLGIGAMGAIGALGVAGSIVGTTSSVIFGPIGLVLGIGFLAKKALDKSTNSNEEVQEEKKIGSQAGAYTLWQKQGISLIGKTLSLLK